MCVAGGPANTGRNFTFSNPEPGRHVQVGSAACGAAGGAAAAGAGRGGRRGTGAPGGGACELQSMIVHAYFMPYSLTLSLWAA